MRRTVWTVFFALLLQLLAGSGWAGRAPQTPDHCHAPSHHSLQAVPDADMDTAASDADVTHSLSTQMDGHHCCAVGLGTAACGLLQTLPQARPHRQHGPWLSLSLSPDLRPPICIASFACA